MSNILSNLFVDLMGLELVLIFRILDEMRGREGCTTRAFPFLYSLRSLKIRSFLEMYLVVHWEKSRRTWQNRSL